MSGTGTRDVGAMKDLMATVYGGGDEAVAVVGKLFKTGEWVRSSERLPPDETWCWAWLKGRGAVVAMRSSHAAGGWTNTDTWEDFRKEVTHWFELPLPDEPEE